MKKNAVNKNIFNDDNYFALWAKDNNSLSYLYEKNSGLTLVFKNINIGKDFLNRSDPSIKNKYVLVPININTPFGATTTDLLIITNNLTYLDADYRLQYCNDKKENNSTLTVTVYDLINIINLHNSDIFDIVIKKKKNVIDIINASKSDDKSMITSLSFNTINDIDIYLPPYTEKVNINSYAYDITHNKEANSKILIRNCDISIIYCNRELLIYFRNINDYISIYNINSISIEEEELINGRELYYKI